jgi:hypothetical protein
VAGRQDTGDLEAQIRGSRHAWDIRLISVDSLIKLVKIKETAEEGTVSKIRELLIPFEYTRVDKIIDIAFTAVTEIGEALEEEDGRLRNEDAQDTPPLPGLQGIHGRTSSEIIQALRQRIVSAVSAREGVPLIKKSRALYWSGVSDNEVRVACTISKRYEKTDDYWYAYHPDWDNFLSLAAKGFYVLGCVDQNLAYAVPHKWIHEHLNELHVSKGKDKPYWHVVPVRDIDNSWALRGYRSSSNFPLSDFTVEI